MHVSVRVYTRSSLVLREMENDSQAPLPKAKRPRNREVLQLPASDFPPALITQLTGLRRYLTEPLSATRKTDPLSQITLQATERRLLSTVIQNVIYHACTLKTNIHALFACRLPRLYAHIKPRRVSGLDAVRRSGDAQNLSAIHGGIYIIIIIIYIYIYISPSIIYTFYIYN